MKKRSQPAWVAAAQCTGKHRFADAGLAKSVAKKTSARHDATTTAYRCEFCGGWHVGNINVTQKGSRKKGNR